MHVQILALIAMLGGQFVNGLAVNTETTSSTETALNTEITSVADTTTILDKRRNVPTDTSHSSTHTKLIAINKDGSTELAERAINPTSPIAPTGPGTTTKVATTTKGAEVAEAVKVAEAAGPDMGWITSLL